VTAAPFPLFGADRWNQMRALVDRLDALDAAARTAELDRIAATDPELAQAVRALGTIRTENGASSVPASRRFAQVGMPEKIGPFTLLREVGSGGMGVVFLAERQGADFTQRVALKLLDGGTARISRLAARERGVLSSLTHPNITAFVDAGSESGCAWLAMEYVDGERLPDHCRQHDLDVQARVRLFDQVCAAVAYAHAQLVVHRDLKPSNVLVNREGTVKLLDFGIALALDSSDPEAPATQVFTPEYAAPEQLRGERATTATDVYALGLMLYELIGGTRLPTLEHGGDWTTAELVRRATGAASGRGSRRDPKSVVRLLRGDLGHIIAHALARAPQDRYQSVALLREDLRRWFDHRPLGIGRPGPARRAARFVRRHRAAVTIAVLAAIALVATSGIALWQAHDARLMAARADHARSFLNELFLNANPYDAKHGTETVVGFLHDAGQRIDTEFADAPDMAILLRSTIASALIRLDHPKAARDLYLRNLEQTTQIYGPRSPQVGEDLSNLARASEDSGDLDAARNDFEKAYALLKDAGEDHARGRVNVMTGLSSMAMRRGDYASAEHWSELVLNEREAHEGPRSPDIAMDLMNLANEAIYQEHFPKALTFAERAHAMLVQVLGPEHPRSIYVDSSLGVALLDMGRCRDAVATLGNAATVARRDLPPGARMLSVVLGNLGRAQACAGDDAAGIASLRQAVAIASATHDLNIGTIELRLGVIELQAHDPEAKKTLDASRRDLSAVASHFQGSSANALWADAAYGDALAVDGKAAEGEKLAREARAKMQAGKDSDNSTLGEIDLLLADVRARRSDAVEAQALREQALQIFERVYGADHPKTRKLAAQLTRTKSG
jgi:serine/threonine-protein kinase